MARMEAALQRQAPERSEQVRQQKPQQRRSKVPAPGRLTTPAERSAKSKKAEPEPIAKLPEWMRNISKGELGGPEAFWDEKTIAAFAKTA